MLEISFVDKKGSHKRFKYLCEYCEKEVVLYKENMVKRKKDDCGCLTNNPSHRVGLYKSGRIKYKTNKIPKQGEYERHNQSGSPTYVSWIAMRSRCKYINHVSYSNYGGRGITVDNDWNIFVNFLRDMGERPDKKTLDRIDVNGNYCKENCKWSTVSEQNSNRRR